jgi:hypothetical protein
MPLFLARQRLGRAKIESMKGRLTGLREHGEKTTLKICRLNKPLEIGGQRCQNPSSGGILRRTETGRQVMILKALEIHEEDSQLSDTLKSSNTVHFSMLKPKAQLVSFRYTLLSRDR